MTRLSFYILYFRKRSVLDESTYQKKGRTGESKFGQLKTLPHPYAIRDEENAGPSSSTTATSTPIFLLVHEKCMSIAL